MCHGNQKIKALHTTARIGVAGGHTLVMATTPGGHTLWGRCGPKREEKRLKHSVSHEVREEVSSCLLTEPFENRSLEKCSDYTNLF